MDFRAEFEEGLRKYKKLNMMWLSAAVLAVVAYYSVPLSFGIAVAAFFAGSLLLSAAGITCAYTIAKENV